MMQILIFIAASSLFLSFHQGEINCQLLQPDNRCFLEDGGSTLTFFIKEDLTVGQQIGRLNIKGTVGRDIDLSVKDINGLYDQLPVELEGEDLVLAAPLDKENINGIDSILIDVVCQRQRSSDPSFSIPVHVRVTDVNDNAPLFIGAPFNLSLSEMTVVGSRILTASSTDADQPGPFSTVEYSVADGPFSDYVAFENPLEGNVVLTKSLDYETMRSFSLTIEAKDQGAPPMTSQAVVTINVIDADDQNPAFLYERYDALLPALDLEKESQTNQGHKLFVQPQDLRAFDKDLGISAPILYGFSGDSLEAKYFELNRNTGQIYAKASIPENEFVQPVTLVIKATQYDNPDRYTVTTLTVTRDGQVGGGTNMLQFLQHSYSFRILENVPLNSVIGTLLINRPNDRRVKYSVHGLPNEEFSVSAKGDLILRKTVDFEVREQYNFSVFISDGRRNDSANIEITLLNINDWDPRFKYPQYEFSVNAEEAFKGHLVGKLEVHDGDTGDSVSLYLRGPYARIFKIATNGDLVIDDLDHLNHTETQIIAIARDSGSPPRETSVPVVVRFVDTHLKHLSHQSRSGINEKFTLTVVLGLLLTVFLVLCLGLSIYICKDRTKRKNSPSPSFESEQHQQMNGNDPASLWRSPSSGVPIAHRSETDLYMASGSTKSSSVTSLPHHLAMSGSTEVALNPLNPQSHSKYASSVTSLNEQRRGSIHQSGLPESSINQQALRDTILGGTGTDLSRLQWPRNSISRRVKKLSWEDESQDFAYDRDLSTFTDPDVSVTPLELQLEPSQVGRAIYF